MPKKAPLSNKFHACGYKSSTQSKKSIIFR